MSSKQDQALGDGLQRAQRRSIFGALSIISLFCLVAFILSPAGSSVGLPRAQPPQGARPEQISNPLRQQARARAAGDKYLLGVGKADITGPVVEINFAGYAAASQVGSGLRQRLYSRAFIIGEVDNPANRFLYMVLDIAFGDTALRRGVLEGVAALGSGYEVYGQSNIAFSGTHSHSGPGAWMNYLLPQITSLGFDKQSYQAIVDGAVLSVKRAHESLTEGYLDIGTTNVTNASINRSLWAYLANPEEERARYGSSVETELTLLRFQRSSDLKNIGVLTWFPVHGTSMLEKNTHVTGDNFGVASYLFERAVAAEESAADGFVAGFSQASVGDTSPRVNGAWCQDGSGQQCSLENSTCADGRSQSCLGIGPTGLDQEDLGVSSCHEIGRRKFSPAKDLYDGLDAASTPVVGPTVRSFHFFHDMRYSTFEYDGKTVQTCPASLGASFAAGTTDGPGAFDFTQGDSGTINNPLWYAVRNLLKTPSAKQVECQKPKPVLLDVGEMESPYAWTANIIDVQTFRVGQLMIVISPSEVTTMAGRRWKSAVKAASSSLKLTTTEPYVVLGSPANTYAHYVTTPEEYAIQRYEGASTLFGQWQLPAYINLTVSNLQYLAPSSASSPPPGPSPPDNRKNSLSFITGVIADGAPLGSKFGDCKGQPAASYARGAVVNATFVGANPRNNLRLEGTFAAVQKLGADGITWTMVRDDSDWELVYTWTRTNSLLGYSDVTLSWETVWTNPAPGTYRIVYYGDNKPLTGAIKAFSGASNSFTLT